MKPLIIRNKNAMLELLEGGAIFEKISIVQNLDQDSLTKKIVSVAKDRGVNIETTPIRKMRKTRSGQTNEVLTGLLIPENIGTLKQLLSDIFENKQDPFFVLINSVNFESNIGIIARTAFAAGVNGLIFQGDERSVLNEDTVHFSMGAIARIPLVKMNMYEALKVIRKNGIRTLCLQMGGDTYSDTDLSGPVAFVLGAEGRGVSRNVLDRCDERISIPMLQGIDSLNVSASTAIVLYEKVRQEVKGKLLKS